MGKRGTRRLERVEIKGNPYNHLMEYSMNVTKEKIIRFLYDMRVAKTSQIARVMEQSKDYTRKNLKDLYINRLVYRDFPPIQKEKYGSAEGVYFLDNQGAFFLAADSGIEKKEVNWDPRDNVVSLGAVKHSLDITEIRTCMEEYKSDLSVDRFIGERRIGRINYIYQGEEINFNPDAYIILKKKLEGKIARISFFLEYDRGTESFKTFLRKIRDYEKFYRSEKIKEMYGTHPGVLIITNHKLRTDRIKKLIMKNKVEDIKYYFATLDEDYKEDPFCFLANN
ncbi:MAG: hypothetical protein FH753_15970 [Firmicutes bacterium]|nr:hypothetical protein [Bacillota bacterium]